MEKMVGISPGVDLGLSEASGGLTEMRGCMAMARGRVREGAWKLLPCVSYLMFVAKFIFLHLLPDFCCFWSLPSFSIMSYSCSSVLA